MKLISTQILPCMLRQSIVVSVFLFMVHPVFAQLSFYTSVSDHPYLTEKVHSDQEVNRIDSVASVILKDTLKYTRRYAAINGTQYYWKEDTLVCAVYRQTTDEFQKRVEWLFENGLTVCMKHTVRLRDGRYQLRDRYYFSRYSDAIGGKGALFAWKWFGRRVHNQCLEFEMVNSSLPMQGKRVFEIGTALIK